jgi:hypothetical protein
MCVSNHCIQVIIDIPLHTSLRSQVKKKTFSRGLIWNRKNFNTEIHVFAPIKLSWTHHLGLGLTIFLQKLKHVLVGLITFLLGVNKIVSYQDLWTLIVQRTTFYRNQLRTLRHHRVI